jgi:nucleosome binding factor SPN SPT16 subunit
MSNEKQQTAVDLMFQKAISVLPMGSIDARRRLKETYEQAKEIEKEQHRKTYHQGLNSNFQDFEQYYNETYKTKKP